MRRLQPYLSNGEPGLWTDQDGQSSAVQNTEGVFTGGVIPEIRDRHARIELRQEITHGIALIRGGQTNLHALFKFTEYKIRLNGERLQDLVRFGSHV